MTEKHLIVETRMMRLDRWLSKQEFDRFWNKKERQVAEFKRKLQEWADRNNAHEVAPTFHTYPGIY